MPLRPLMPGQKLICSALRTKLVGFMQPFKAFAKYDLTPGIHDREHLTEVIGVVERVERDCSHLLWWEKNQHKVWLLTRAFDGKPLQFCNHIYQTCQEADEQENEKTTPRHYWSQQNSIQLILELREQRGHWKTIYKSVIDRSLHRGKKQTENYPQFFK